MCKGGRDGLWRWSWNDQSMCNVSGYRAKMSEKKTCRRIHSCYIRCFSDIGENDCWLPAGLVADSMRVSGVVPAVTWPWHGIGPDGIRAGSDFNFVPSVPFAIRVIFVSSSASTTDTGRLILFLLLMPVTFTTNNYVASYGWVLFDRLEERFLIMQPIQFEIFRLLNSATDFSSALVLAVGSSQWESSSSDMPPLLLIPSFPIITPRQLVLHLLSRNDVRTVNLILISKPNIHPNFSLHFLPHLLLNPLLTDLLNSPLMVLFHEVIGNFLFKNFLLSLPNSLLAFRLQINLR